jgi:protein-L-isoaspartate O-methyltransferase
VTTALDPAALRCAELVKTLVDRGVLTDLAWREAFATVPREAFVPRFARREQCGQLVHYDHAAEDGTVDFIAAVYSDTSLITRFNAAGIATSSSTQPSLMTIMLERLDIHEGHTVLTGSSPPAACLASPKRGSARRGRVGKSWPTSASDSLC